MIKRKTIFSSAHLGGEQGDVTLPLCLLLLALGLFMTITYKKLALMSVENQQRKETYLCLKQTMDRFTSLYNFISKTNLSIIALNASYAIKPNPVSLKMKKLIQQLQHKKSLFVIARLFKSTYCKGVQKTFIKKAFPLKRKGLNLQRTIFGTALYKKKPSSFLLPSRSFAPFLFIIKGTIAFSPQLRIEKSTEIPLSFHTWL